LITVVHYYTSGVVFHPLFKENFKLYVHICIGCHFGVINDDDDDTEINERQVISQYLFFIELLSV